MPAGRIRYAIPVRFAFERGASSELRAGRSPRASPLRGRLEGPPRRSLSAAHIARLRELDRDLDVAKFPATMHYARPEATRG